MANATAGQAELFAENFNRAVKNIVLAKQLLKNEAVNVETSTSAEEHFYQESVGELGSVTNIPRGSEFPADQVQWTKVTLRPQKFGLESRIDWESTIVENPDIPARTTLRVANRIARDVDSHIWNTISENQSALRID